MKANWHLKATRPYLIGGYGDNFNYDDSRGTPMLGTAELALDAEKDSGSMVIRLIGTINPEKEKSYTGDITIYFRPVKGGPPFQEGGVADFIYLHGDTRQGLCDAKDKDIPWGLGQGRCVCKRHVDL